MPPLKRTGGTIPEVRCLIRSSSSIPSAFSLLEVVLVVAIISILVAIAVPKFAGQATRHRCELAANKVALDLKLLKTSAEASGSALKMSFDTKTHQVTSDDLTAIDPHHSKFVTDLSERPYLAKIQKVDFGGDAEVVFTGWGLPDTGGQIVLQVGTELKTVTLDASSGAVSIQ